MPYQLPHESPAGSGGGSSSPYSPPFSPLGSTGGRFGGGYEGFSGYSPYASRRKPGMGAGPMPGGEWNKGGPMGEMGSSLSYLRDPSRGGWSGGGSTASAGAPPAGGGGGGDYWDALIARLTGSDIGYSHAAPSDYNALSDMILGGAGRGMYGPEGDPRVLAAYDQDASRRGMAQEQSAVLGASLDGQDAWSGGLARMMARANAQRSKSDFYNQNRLNSAQNYSDLIRQLLAGKLGMYDTEKQRGWQLEDSSRAQANQNKLFPWQLGGQVLGAAVGSWGGGKKG